MPKHAFSVVQPSGAEGGSRRIVPSAAEIDTLFLQQPERSKMSPARRNRAPREETMDPTVKSWIDRVIVPALVARWNERKVPMKGDQ
jgi:hypothetical protein